MSRQRVHITLEFEGELDVPHYDASKLEAHEGDMADKVDKVIAATHGESLDFRSFNLRRLEAS